MLLEPLVSTIKTIKGRIDTHGSALRENETRTRLALIDPLLQALGWDTSDPTMVAPEYSAGNGRADYALLGEAKNPVAFIEAKHLWEPLERQNHQEQVFTYALIQQVKYAGLTDGNRWILDNVSDFSGDRRILDISIADLTAYESALKLLLLWQRNLASGQPVSANGPLFSVHSEGEPTIVPQPPTPTPVPDRTENWISLSTVNAGRGNPPPKGIKLPGREPLDIKFWWQVLVELADALAKDEKLTTADCPISGLGFVSPSSDTFRRYKTISGGLYVSVNWNADNIIRHSRKLLSHFGIDPDTVQLQFD